MDSFRLGFEPSHVQPIFAEFWWRLSVHAGVIGRGVSRCGGWFDDSELVRRFWRGGVGVGAWELLDAWLGVYTEVQLVLERVFTYYVDMTEERAWRVRACS
jgi:hypothetical protein